MTLPVCQARRDLHPERDEYVCLHPRVHAPAQRIDGSICRMCGWAAAEVPNQRPFPTIQLGMAFATMGMTVDRSGLCFHLGDYLREEHCATCSGNVRIKHYACRHSEHDETTVAECRQCPDFEPQLKKGGVRDWAVGVVTAPRESPTLARTLASLSAAGWSAPWVFAEPRALDGVQLPEQVAVVQRPERLGLWPNWLLSLTELTLRFPDADAYFLCEDDVVFCRDLRAYLEATLWPAAQLGAVSLFCAGVYARTEPGWFEVDAGWDFAGAQALVFPPPAARQFLAHPLVVHHRRRGPHQGTKDTDAVVGLWANLSKLPIFVHSPSPAQHIGDESTVGHGAALGGYRSATDFLGEDGRLRHDLEVPKNLPAAH